MLRRRLYLRWFFLVAVASLVPAILLPDILEASAHLQKVVPAHAIASEVHEWLTSGPIWFARLLGFSINGHAAQMWPSGWPWYLAHHLRMCLAFVPFWFLVGVPILELVLFVRKRRRVISDVRA